MTDEFCTPTQNSRIAINWIRTFHMAAVFASVVFLSIIAFHPRWVMPTELIESLPSGWMPPLISTCLSLLGVFVLVSTPWIPVLGLLVFVVLAYAFPRVGYDFSFYLHWHILEFISGLSALGYCVWLYTNGRLPSWTGHRLALLFILFLVWIVNTTVIATIRGIYIPAVNHHPFVMFNALVMFMLAAEFFSTSRNIELFFSVLALTLCLRSLLAPQWIKGNGDLGMLMAISIPLTIASALIVKHFALRGFFLLVSIVQGIILFHTTNRGGALAIFLAAFAAWLMSRSRLKFFFVSLPILLFAGLLFIHTGYWQKFSDIWQGGYWKKTVDSRIDLWKGGFRMGMEAPIFGVGIGNFEHRVGKYTGSGKSDSPHNVVIGMFAEAGLPGVMLYLSFFAGALYLSAKSAFLFKDGWMRILSISLFSSLIAYLIGGMFLTRHTMTLAYLLAGGVLAISQVAPKYCTTNEKLR